MSRIDAHKPGALPLPRILALALSAVLAVSGAQAGAQGRTPPAETAAAQHTLADLERAFWVCDHAATFHGVLDMGTATACAEVTRDFRLRKFNGDFDALLGWWQRNKAHQHQLLDMRYRAAVQR